MIAAVVTLALVVALLTLLVVGLLRSHAEILRELHALRTTSGPQAAVSGVLPAPVPSRSDGDATATDVAGVDPAGDAIQVGVVGTRHSTLLLFLSSGCSTCWTFWEALARPATLGVRDGIRPVAVTKGPEAESPAAIAAIAPTEIVTVMSSSAWTDYSVRVVPYAVLVDGPSRRVVGEGSASTWERVRDLLHQALDDAGLDTGSGASSGLRRRGGATGQRDDRVDADLRTAGITPGHPSLYTNPLPAAPEVEEDRGSH